MSILLDQTRPSSHHPLSPILARPEGLLVLPFAQLFLLASLHEEKLASSPLHLGTYLQIFCMIADFHDLSLLPTTVTQPSTCNSFPLFLRLATCKHLTSNIPSSLKAKKRKHVKKKGGRLPQEDPISVFSKGDNAIRNGRTFIHIKTKNTSFHCRLRMHGCPTPMHSRIPF